MSIILRESTFHLYRRVPKRYARVDSRTFVKISLKTDSRAEAEAKAPAVWQQLVEAWEAKLAGATEDAEQAFEAARELAQVRGFRYMPLRSVAELPVNELLDRVDALRRTQTQPGKVMELREADAIMGGAPEPKIKISRALKLYWELAREKTLGKSEDQLRRWRNPRIKAIGNLISVIGDKPISEITGDDMLDFRGWWLERIETEGLTAGSANKDLVHLGDVLKTVNKLKRLGLVLPLSDLSFKQGEAKTRPPFSDSWIREKLLSPGALTGMNEEARAIMLVMVNTGCRPSEIAGLTAANIHLSSNVPHMAIEPEGRQLKSRNARRRVVLTGISLEALRGFPDGFPRYRESSASLSAAVNKYLRENGLLETPEHSLYSLRHSFEDRMLANGVDERVRRDLLGHALNRERYGAGASLEMQQELLQPFAL